MKSSVTACDKSTPHVGMSEWHTKQWELHKAAEICKKDGFDQRQCGRIVRFETATRTKWDTYTNNVKIADRVTELTRWHHLIQMCVDRIDIEIAFLKDDKVETETQLEKIMIPLQIVTECISIRDCRRPTEQTDDDASVQLRKELNIIETAKKLLSDRVKSTWEKLMRFETVKHKIELDLDDRNKAIDIDTENFNLNEKSSAINYKPNVINISKVAVSYEAWLENCRNIKHLAEAEVEDAYAFREVLKTSRDQAKNDIKTQQDVTDFALRKRIYQTKKSVDELEWQKLKVQKEMDILMKEIKQIEIAISSKAGVQKCAETRLDNRTVRPGFEHCIDEVDEGLKEEVLQLRQTVEHLTQKSNCAKTAYNNLESVLTRLEKDLQDKHHTLMTDIMCLDTRCPFKNKDHHESINETNRNIALMQMTDKIPMES